MTTDRLAALEAAVSNALAAATEGGDYTEAPEPSDEPGSPYVKHIARSLAAAGVTVAPQPDEGLDETVRNNINPLRPRDDYGFAPQSLDVERVATFLHDQYGCRVTCRGGRLADDRHPSHNEAYRDQAERLIAAAYAEDSFDYHPPERAYDV